jgi:dihydroneopterin aldolase
MIHYNYHKSLIENCKTSKSFAILEKIAESMSQGDIIENYIYGEQCWNIKKLHGYYSCAAPSYYLTHDMKSNNRVNIEFTKDLSKTSIRFINGKNKTKSDKFFENNNTLDYIHIGNIVKTLIETENHKECAEIMNFYNINIDQLETLLKINKIDSVPDNKQNAKKIISTKDRNIIKNLLI